MTFSLKSSFLSLKKLVKFKILYVKICRMIQTLEAIADKSGKIRLLTEISLEENRRALVTILDEQPKISFDLNVEMPTNESVSDEEVLGVWANRKESAQEISRTIRQNNRKTT